MKRSSGFVTATIGLSVALASALAYLGTPVNREPAPGEQAPIVQMVTDPPPAPSETATPTTPPAPVPAPVKARVAHTPTAPTSKSSEAARVAVGGPSDAHLARVRACNDLRAWEEKLSMVRNEYYVLLKNHPKEAPEAKSRMGKVQIEVDKRDGRCY